MVRDQLGPGGRVRKVIHVKHLSQCLEDSRYLMVAAIIHIFIITLRSYDCCPCFNMFKKLVLKLQLTVNFFVSYNFTFHQAAISVHVDRVNNGQALSHC